MTSPVARSALACALALALLACRRSPEEEERAVPRKSTPPPACEAAPVFAWPRGAKAAVSLTYDDALPSQLDHALPKLEAVGFRATFFLSEGDRFRAERQRFARLAPLGHELGAHTVRHPCGNDLRRYDLDAMRRELLENQRTLRALGEHSERLTFAYPCGHTAVGAELAVSYVPLVRELFVAARGARAGVSDPVTETFDQSRAFFPDGVEEGRDALRAIDQAIAAGGWLTLGFHGVGSSAEYLPLSQRAHDRILDYLRSEQARVWTAPYGAVAEYVLRCRRAR